MNYLNSFVRDEKADAEEIPRGAGSGISRRTFLQRCAVCGIGLACSPPLTAQALFWQKNRNPYKTMPVSRLHEASDWERLSGGRTRCLICPNECVRDQGGITLCNTKINRDGTLYTMTYGSPCVVFQDPLEKNPLYHVDPGSEAIGVGTAGCNLTCKYCQNWNFSQTGPWKTKNMDLSPRELIKKIKKRGLNWLTFSYTEPVAYYEYALESARLAQRAGIHVAVVTAGFINPEPLKKLMAVSDAFSVTLKGYDDDFYRDVIGCELEPVWDTISTISRAGKWVEVVNLIIPSLNDEMSGIAKIARALAKLNRNIPLHFLKFSPAYKMKSRPSTPLKTLEQARKTALAEGLKYVYLANVPGHEGGTTYCPNCKKPLIERAGFRVLNNRVTNGRCNYCRTNIAGLLPK